MLEAFFLMLLPIPCNGNSESACLTSCITAFLWMLDMYAAYGFIEHDFERGGISKKKKAWSIWIDEDDDEVKNLPSVNRKP